MNYETTYTIHIQDQKFTLSHSQIKFESPNYFTTCFLGDFYESQTRSVHLTRSPAIFPLIQQYLCGYMVLPLSDDAIPKGMNVTQAIANLRADALFYQLEGLVEQCDVYLEPVKRGLPASHRYLLVGWEVSKTEKVNILSLEPMDLSKHLPTPKQMGWHLYVTKQELEKLNFKNMTMRDEFIKGGTEGISALTGLTCVVDKILPKDGRRRWVVGVYLKRYLGEGEEEEEEDQEDEESEEEGEEGEEERGEEGSVDDNQGVTEDDDDDEEWEDDEGEDAKFDGFDGEIIIILLEE